MTTMQISSQEMIEQYCDILLFHQIRPEQLVIEINVDQALPENILKENIQYQPVTVTLKVVRDREPVLYWPARWLLLPLR